MFVAHAASLRSAALGRQVGASILDETGAVMAVGTNEVPKAGGGQYWVNDPYDYRDHRYEDGSDSSDTMRRAIIGELLERYKKFGIEHPVRAGTKDALTVDDLVPILKGTRIGSLVEFGRAVHAEMAAITDAARRGVSIAGGTLYSTTFPCHNCARHLVAAGIREVVYVEPYAKSLAMNLHRDAIVLSSDSKGSTHIPFRQFIGVAPRRYAQLFTMVDRKDELGYRLTFRPEGSLPRDVDLQAFYQHREARAIGTAGRAIRMAGFETDPDLLNRAVYD
jgi:deoxycytidylate deaminase